MEEKECCGNPEAIHKEQEDFNYAGLEKEVMKEFMSSIPRSARRKIMNVTHDCNNTKKRVSREHKNVVRGIANKSRIYNRRSGK